MDKINKTQIKSFKCIEPMNAWWSSLFTVGKEYEILNFGKRKVHIYTDSDSYFKGLPVIAGLGKNKIKPSDEEIKRNEELFERLCQTYEMEVEIEYIEFKSDDGSPCDFSIQTIDDIIKKYNLDASKKVEFTTSIYVFEDYFDTRNLNRSYSLIELLG